MEKLDLVASCFFQQLVSDMINLDPKDENINTDKIFRALYNRGFINIANKINEKRSELRKEKKREKLNELKTLDFVSKNYHIDLAKELIQLQHL